MLSCRVTGLIARCGNSEGVDSRRERSGVAEECGCPTYGCARVSLHKYAECKISSTMICSAEIIGIAGIVSTLVCEGI